MAAKARAGYGGASRSLAASFVFIAPLVALYEIGVLLDERARNGADPIFRALFSRFSHLGVLFFNFFLLGEIVAREDLDLGVHHLGQAGHPTGLGTADLRSVDVLTSDPHHQAGLRLEGRRRRESSDRDDRRHDQEDEEDRPLAPLEDEGELLSRVHPRSG